MNNAKLNFLFLDESGRYENKNLWNYFIICGIIINGEEILSCENDLSEVAKKHEVDSLKQFRKNKKFNLDEKIKITEEIFQILQKHKVKVLSSVIKDYYVQKSVKKEESYFNALEFLIERFFLELKNENSIGVVIADSFNTKEEKKLKNKFYEYISKEALKWVYSGRIEGFYKERIFPYLIFTEDSFCKILQVSDLIAAALNGAIKKEIARIKKENKADILINVENLNQYNPFLSLYWPLFARSPEGKIGGWGIKIWF